jgi:hypothetical protein
MGHFADHFGFSWMKILESVGDLAIKRFSKIAKRGFYEIG